MYTGALIDDLFEAVERAEKSAAKRHASPEIEETVLMTTGTSADRYQEINLETE